MCYLGSASSSGQQLGMVRSLNCTLTLGPGIAGSGLKHWYNLIAQTTNIIANIIVCNVPNIPDTFINQCCESSCCILFNCYFSLFHYKVWVSKLTILYRFLGTSTIVAIDDEKLPIMCLSVKLCPSRMCSSGYYYTRV